MQNLIKTTILFAVLTSIMIAGGYFIGGGNGLLIMLAVSVLFNAGTYWFGADIALRMAGAKLVSTNDLPTVFSDAAEIAERMNIPMPRIYLSPNVQPNAFAAGRGKNNAVICLTKGLVDYLDRAEVRGVIAHELAHIKNNDILIATIAATMAGIISSLGDIFLFGSIFGGNREERNPIASLLFIMLAPIMALLIQLAVSRSREYVADSTAARFTGEPQHLANALMKISTVAKQMPMQTNPALASLYIESPVRMSGIAELFSTHPNIDKRINRLLNLNY